MFAYGVRRRGNSKPIGPTVLLLVGSSGQTEDKFVIFEDVKLKQYRIPQDEDPALQALRRWGFKV